MPVSKMNYIHSRNGQIDNGTDHDPQDVDNIISSIRASGEKRLIIHFHGGLVSKADGLQIAETLTPVYSAAG